MGAGDVQLPTPLVNPAPGTEVGQVTDAVNRMLVHVESAFTERQATETLLRHFVADASHELRTPVAVIRSHAEFAQMAGPDLGSDVKDALTRITAESVRMGGLVDDLLLLARLDSGRPLYTAPLDLTRVVLDAVIDAQVLGTEHDWQLDLPEHEVIVDGDENPLRQVVVNLLANAREHTPPGTQISVALSEDEPWVTLVVADDGPGIPADLLPHIFERFARADSAREHTSGESGLGLAIVDAIVRAHAGVVSATSEPGTTIFTVRIRSRVRPPADGTDCRGRPTGVLRQRRSRTWPTGTNPRPRSGACVMRVSARPPGRTSSSSLREILSGTRWTRNTLSHRNCDRCNRAPRTVRPLPVAGAAPDPHRQ